MICQCYTQKIVVLCYLTDSVSPLICNASAVLMKAGKASCLTLTSPQYMNWIKSLSAEELTSFKKTVENFEMLIYFLLNFEVSFLPNACWFAGIWVNILRKYGEQTDNTSRWALTSCPSAASVTSTRSPRHSDSWKPADRFVLKLFQHKENCSSSAIFGDV